MSVQTPHIEAIESVYGSERDKVYDHVKTIHESEGCDYGIESVSKFNSRCFVGFEVVVSGKVSLSGTLQDIVRGAYDDWFVREVEPVDNGVRYEMLYDHES